MSYRGVLKRGFSVTRGPSGAILRSAAEAGSGEMIETELADGKLASRVTGDGSGAESGESEPARPPQRSARRRPAPPDGPTLFE